MNILLYSIKLNNFKFIKFINNKTTIDILDNKLNTPYHYLSLYSKENELFNLFNFNDLFINKQNLFGETFLHTAINNNNDILIKYLIDKKILNRINLNLKDYKYELTVIHYLIVNNKDYFFNYFTNYNLNLQDYRGRSYLHYFIIYNKKNLIIDNNKLKFNYNLCDINGSTPLHLILQSSKFIDSKNIIDKFIKKTNLNLQDNKGNTSLYYLIKNNIWKNHIDILVNKN